MFKASLVQVPRETTNEAAHTSYLTTLSNLSIADSLGILFHGSDLVSARTLTYHPLAGHFISNRLLFFYLVTLRLLPFPGTNGVHLAHQTLTNTGSSRVPPLQQRPCVHSSRL